jgi:lysine 2,3-aminomutase
MEKVTADEGRPPHRPGRTRYFPEVSDADWNDWRWQFRHRITSLEGLTPFIPIPPAEWDLRREVLRDFRMGITPYYLSLIDSGDPDDPILRQVVPLRDEYTYREVGDEDPLGEENFSPVPGITHRYPDRVLMVISNSCAVYCRYCTRKRIMYEDAVPDLEIDRMIDYIARTPAVRDVVVSGGDPLNNATPKLERILAKLRAIPHLEIIRIGTRVPVALPQRIDDELCAMLQKYHPVWVNVHFNHPRECTPEAARACDKLSRAGVPLNNQSVLLRGVNDDVATMKALMHALMRMRVRPYYVYHCDPVRGTEHMRTTIAKGIEIMEGLRGHTSGLAVPTYVIDAPGGGGKIPVGPQYLMRYDPAKGRALLRNFQGKLYDYSEIDSSARLAPAAVRPAARNGNGKATARNGNGNGNGRSGAGRAGREAAATLDPEPVVGRSTWAHNKREPVRRKRAAAPPPDSAPGGA